MIEYLDMEPEGGTMKLNMISALQEAGVDTEGGLRRFCGDHCLYEGFLKKFLSDSTFQDLGTALETGDEHDSLNMAHTLKGLTANLGFTRLFSISSQMVDLIRKDRFVEAAGKYTELRAVYGEICEILSRA